MHTPAAEPGGRGQRGFWVAVAAVVLLHLGALVALAAQTPWTTDEPNYLAAGVVIRNDFEFEAFSTILHGPLTFYGNQWLLPGGLAHGDPALPRTKLRARLGMLPFALAAALLLAVLARRAFGPGVALAALVLHATNPIVLAHGCLITADMALTAGYLATAWAAWRWLRAPSLGRLTLAGAMLGASLATKYLALFLLPALGLCAAIAVLRGVRPALLFSRAPDAGPGRRLLDLVPAALLCGVVALLTLHSCYLWRAGGYVVKPPKYELAKVDAQDPDAGPMSSAMRALVELPGAAAALRLLPEPFVRGVDYQKFYAERGGVSYFAGAFGPGFWAYFAVALAVKLPLAFLLLLLGGLLLRAPPWPRHLALLTACLVLVPLVYLSGFTVLQIGVRYALPVLPLLALIAGRPAAVLWPRPLGKALLGACLLWLLAALALDWPRLIGSFNALAGSRPYLLFKDSNLDWRHVGWTEDRDAEAIAARHPDSQLVFATSGPRLGKLRIHGVELSPADPREPSGEKRRAYFWLRRFEPVDRLGAWYVFDVSEASFRAAVGLDTPDPDPRGVTELAAALVGDGRPGDALALLEGVDDPQADLVRRAAEMARAGRTRDPAYAQLLLELDRPDLVAAWPEPLPVPLAALAHFRRGDIGRARALLEGAEARGALDFNGAMLLATTLRAERRLDDALAALRRHTPPPAYAALHADLVRKLEDEIEALAPLGGRDG